MGRKPKIMPVQPPVWYPRGDKGHKYMSNPDLVKGTIIPRGNPPKPSSDRPVRPTPPVSPYAKPKSSPKPKANPKPKTKTKPKTGNKKGGTKNKSSVMAPNGVWSILSK